MMETIWSAFLEDKGIVLLDGAMATELEARGADLNHSLWSAKLLRENPLLIQEVHYDYLKAGADVLTTASYQASFAGFAQQGITKEEAVELMQLSVYLALRAREQALYSEIIRTPKPLVAASVGPYGAYLADGSEYKGNYGVSKDDLKQFHRERMAVLLEAGADLLAFETIPCMEEAIALIELLAEFPDAKAWLSYSCKNDKETCGGQLFADAVALANTSNQIVAVGVNCTAPEYISALIGIATNNTNKPILVYPNKGETYDAVTKCWLPNHAHPSVADSAVEWKQAGASLIGGCCRTSPADIAAIKLAIQEVH